MLAVILVMMSGLPLTLAAPVFDLGACGLFTDISSGVWGPMLYAAKVALEEGFLDDQLASNEFTVTVNMIETGCSAQGVSQKMLPALLGEGQTAGRIYSANTTTDPVLAIVGCMCSAVSVTVSQISAPLYVPMVSMSSTAPSLSDKDQHPYFARVVPPDSMSGAGLVGLVRYFSQRSVHGEWSRVSLIYSRTVYGEGVADVFSNDDQLSNFTVVKESFVSIETVVGTTEKEYASVVEAAGRLAAETPALKVFVFPADLAMSPIVFRAFAEAGLFSDDCVGLATEGVTAALFTIIDTLAAGRAAFLAGDDSLSDEEVEFYSGSVGNYNWTQLQEVLLGWISLKPDGKGARVQGTAFSDFWTGLSREKLLAAGMPSVLETQAAWFQDTSVILEDSWAAFIFDAAASIIVAIGDLLASGLDSEDVKGEALRDAIYSSKFEGLTGDIELNSQGDRLGSYRINNIRSLRSLEDIGEYNAITDTITFDRDPIFPSGSTEVPRDRPEPCPIGTERQGDSCEACEAGKYNPTEDSSCLDCFAGTYTTEAGAASCSTAPAGSFVASTGSTAARLCEPGTVSSTIGASECLSCQQGYYTENRGQTECNWCPQGTYSETVASSSCTSCLAGETTASVGSRNETECVCDEGSYRPFSSGRTCISCPTGMTCAVGSDMQNWADGNGAFPLSAIGYMTLHSEPLVVYRCLLDAHCPGGVPGTCAANHDPKTIACGECDSDSYPDSAECKACSGSDAIFLFVGAIVAAVIVATAITVVVGRDSLSQTNSTVACAVGLGLVLTGIQSLGVYDQLSITWLDPVKALVEVANIFSFNMNVLKTSCLFGSDPLLHYLGRLLIFPVLLPFIGLVSWKKLAPTEQLLPVFVNNAGALFSICFISVVVSCVLPLVCYPHPDGALKSMRASPSTLCFEGGQHTAMALIGALTFLGLPIPFVVITLYGAWAYPTLIRQMSSRGRLQALRFLYIKFTPECYFYAPFPLVRNLMVSLVPVVTNKAAAQITSLCAVFSVFTLVQVRLWPWRGTFVNIVDSLVSTLLQLTLITGALVTGTSQLDGAVKTVNVAVVVCFIIVFVAVGAFVIYNLGMRNRNKYDTFVCHHKASAAAQARLLKMKLTSRGQSVFIDSDDLSDLDDLFDIVKCKVRQLCVMLTRDTLRRPWCAGEITTAFNTSSVKILRVRMPCFLRPTEEQLMDLGSYVDETGCCLRQYGMTYEAVADAFASLLSSETPAILVKKPPASFKHHDYLVNAIVKGADACLFDEKVMVPDLLDSSGQVLVSAERNSDEAVAAAWILYSKLQEKLFQRDGQRAELLCLFEHNEGDFLTLMQCVESAKAVLLLLSPSSLNTWGQICVICQSIEVRQINESLIVLPMMLPGFSFPTEQYYEEVLPKLTPTYYHEFNPILRSFFKLIVTPLSTHASDSTLELEVTKIVERIPPSATCVLSEHSGQIVGSKSMLPTVTQRVGNLSTASGVEMEISHDDDDWDETKSQDIQEIYSC